MKIYSTGQIKFLLILPLLLFTQQLFAQSAPNISYGVPQTYKVGTMIAPNGPTNTGGAGQVNGQTSTFAGSGSTGYANGQGTAASFNLPLAIAQDAQNNLYVADYASHIIRKITPTGLVSTLAGSANNHGTTDGTGSTARFNGPRGLAVDASGNIYVADYGNNLIRKVTQAGVVTTIAGSGAIGSADGTGTSASFNGPISLCLDASGNILVSDYSNHTIRKVTPAGVVTTLAGIAGTASAIDGTLATATFNHPYGMGLDASGNIYVSDRGNAKIRKITPGGTVSTLAGNGTSTFADGTGSGARFNNPCGLSLDLAGNIYVADNANQRIRKVTQAGVVTTIAGTGTSGFANGEGDSTLFYNPFSILADNDGGFVYVGDYNNRIRTVAVKPYTISPDLPAGLNFDSMNGAITGTPETASASATYVVTEYNGTGKDTAHVVLSVGAAELLSNSNNQNYIVSYTPRIAGINNTAGIYSNSANQSHVQTNIQYFDGLGRPIQTVQVKGSPMSKDIVQPMTYDSLGREAIKYLPYADNSSVYGNYKDNAIADQKSIYMTPPAGISQIKSPYAVTAFEPSPLSRITEQGAPGDPWQLTASGVTGSGHTVEISYFSNDNSTHKVAQYTATINADGSRTLSRGRSNTMTYNPGTLQLTVVADENWTSGQPGTTETYTDRDGHLLLKRMFNDNGGSVQALSTYYVYDDKGNLAYVLPPGANPDATSAISQSTLDNRCYQYRYDERDRLIQKKLPGRGWEFSVYNFLDQLVATQDSVQRANNNWIFTKYDALGRSVITGIWNNGGTAIRRDSLQASMTRLTANLWEKPATTSNGYTNIAWPTSSVTATLNINYYDSYSTIPGLPATYTLTNGVSQMTRGLLTAKKTAVLNTPTDMLWGVMYYDDLGRTITSYGQHYLGGTVNVNNYDLMTTTYNFTNAPITVSRQHYTSLNTSLPIITVVNNYIYDHMGRKVMTWEQITNGNNVPTTNTLISKIDYNEIGQTYKKHLHSIDWTHFLQDIQYTYNERGWLLKSSAPLFEEQLQYNSVNNITGITPTAQYNGNIASQSWGTGAAPNTTSFVYAYDKLNRLTSGISTDHNAERGITYDAMGNLNTLSRLYNNVLIDSLAYSYTTPGGTPTYRLQNVIDNSADVGSLGYKTGTWTYAYDANGNMKTDNSKGISSITYNLLNLPQSIPDKNTTYTYDADGQKLRTAIGTFVEEYINGIQYNGTTIDFIKTEEGRVLPNGSDYNYEYTLTDHLGNSRYVFDTANGTARRQQQDDYLPFGMDISRGAIGPPQNLYLYNGKELQLSTQWYDHGARFYDPVIGRWTTPDPLGETNRRMSLYTYGSDNPIKTVDPDGMEDKAVTGETLDEWAARNIREFEALMESTDPAWVRHERGDNAAKAFVFTAATKSIELEEVAQGVGKGVSKTNIISLYLGMLFLSGDNMSVPDRMKFISNVIAEDINKGDIASASKVISEWNLDKRNKDNKIVFRYMSNAEFKTIYKNVDGGEFMLPFGPKGNVTNKWITPDFYTSSKAAYLRLALPVAPQVAVWTFEYFILASKMPQGPGRYQTVRPGPLGQPGGGNEATIFQPFPVLGGFILSK